MSPFVDLGIERISEQFARHNNLRIGGDVDHFLVVHDERTLITVMNIIRTEKLKYRISYPFSDVFCREEGIAGVVIRLGRDFDRLAQGGTGIIAGVNTPLSLVGLMAGKLGFEGLSLMETWAGCVGEWLQDKGTSEHVVSARVLKGRGIKEVSFSDISGGIVLEVEIYGKPSKSLRPPDPGQIFDSRRGLASQLEKSRMSGFRLRSIKIPSSDPTLVVNLGGGNSLDLELVVSLAQQRLERDHGRKANIRLSPVVRRKGRKGL